MQTVKWTAPTVAGIPLELYSLLLSCVPLCCNVYSGSSPFYQPFSSSGSFTWLDCFYTFFSLSDHWLIVWKCSSCKVNPSIFILEHANPSHSSVVWGMSFVCLLISPINKPIPGIIPDAFIQLSEVKNKTCLFTKESAALQKGFNQ